MTDTQAALEAAGSNGSFLPVRPGLRTIRVVDILSELQDYQCQVDVHDPWVDAAESAGGVRYHFD